MDKEITIKSVFKTDASIHSLPTIEVEYEVEGIKKKVGFVGYEEWMEKVNGVEKFKLRLKEEVNRTQTTFLEPTKTELTQFKEEKI